MTPRQRLLRGGEIARVIVDDRSVVGKNLLLGDAPLAIPRSDFAKRASYRTGFDPVVIAPQIPAQRRVILLRRLISFGTHLGLE